MAALSLAGCSGSDGGDGNESTSTPEPTYEVDQEAPARLKLLSVSGPKEDRWYTKGYDSDEVEDDLGDQISEAFGSTGQKSVLMA